MRWLGKQRPPPRDPTTWLRWFALLPTRVGFDENGRPVWVWLEWFKYRRFENAGEYWEIRGGGAARPWLQLRTQWGD